MIAEFQERLAGAECLMEQASLSGITEIPARLSEAIGLVSSAVAGIGEMSASERELAKSGLRSFRARLAIFSLAMQRSEAIFRGYSRRAGASLHEYGPAGSSCGVRDPAFLNFTA